MFMLTIFETKKARTQKNHLKNLISLAKADGKISEKELELIYKAGAKIGFRENEISSILEDTKLNPGYNELPGNDSERFDQIFDLIQMMMADGEIDDAEMDFCILIAEKLGFRKAIVGILVRKISLGLNSGREKETIKAETEAFLQF